MKSVTAALAILAAALAFGQDAKKRMAEFPVKEALSANAPAGDGKVTPGKVSWHPSFEAAVEAAGRSGKPVLLFQLLGKLDEEWC